MSVEDISHSNQSQEGQLWDTAGLGVGGSLAVRSILRAKEQNISITTYKSSAGALGQEASIKEDHHGSGKRVHKEKDTRK